jgi:DeoR/GlpR family transcriptional regulator of sugar metabolism
MSEKSYGSFYEEREQIILDLLQKKGRITVAEAAKLTGLSASTIRLQFQSMHDKGLLLRTHGGAIKADYPQRLNNQSDIFNGIVNLDKKLQIATAAAETIHDGDFIAISSGSTALLLASKITDRKNLTVVTDSIPVAYLLLFHTNIKLYICGGQIRERNGACFGPTSESFFSTVKVDKAYSGCDSVDPDIGITSLDIDPRTEQALVKCAKECYILADSTKFSVKPFIEKVLDIKEITCLVSDSELESNYIEKIKESGVNVLLGSPE